MYLHQAADDCLPSSRRGCHSAPKLCKPFTVESVELEAGVRRPSVRRLEARGGCLDFRTPMWLDACFGCYRSSAPPQQNVRTALANNRASMRTARSVESACSWCRASSKTRPGNHKKIAPDESMGNILPQLEVAYVESVYVDNKLPGMHNAGQVCIPQRRHGRSAACTSIYPTHTHTRALSVSPSSSNYSWTSTPVSATQ